ADLRGAWWLPGTLWSGRAAALPGCRASAICGAIHAGRSPGRGAFRTAAAPGRGREPGPGAAVLRVGRLPGAAAAHSRPRCRSGLWRALAGAVVASLGRHVVIAAARASAMALSIVLLRTFQITVPQGQQGRAGRALPLSDRAHLRRI